MKTNSLRLRCLSLSFLAFGLTCCSDSLSRVGAAEPAAGDAFKTASGDLVVRPINHASLVLIWNGKAIYVDPVGAAQLYQGLPKADLVLVAHGHGDHYSSATIEAARKPDAPIIAPRSVCNSLPASLKPAAVPLVNGASTNLLGLTVEAVPAYNLAARFHPKGEGNGYVITLGGKRVYISGDTEDIPEMRALKDIDLAFLCMNQPYTMTVDQAASAVREFKPKVVYPYHYRNQDRTFADLALFKQKAGSGIEVRTGKWY